MNERKDLLPYPYGLSLIDNIYLCILIHVGSYPQKRWNFEKILDCTPAIPMLVKLIGIVKYGSCHYSPYHFQKKQPLHAAVLVRIQIYCVYVNFYNYSLLILIKKRQKSITYLIGLGFVVSVNTYNKINRQLFNKFHSSKITKKNNYYFFNLPPTTDDTPFSIFLKLLLLKLLFSLPARPLITTTHHHHHHLSYLRLHNLNRTIDLT